MSETRIPSPDELTRQPGRPSAGGNEDATQGTGEGAEAITPEQAVEEARQARETAERERDAARVREQTAARERDEARQRATDAGSQAWTAQEQATDHQIQAQTTLAEQAKNAIAVAQASGDHIAVADAFDKLAEARANIRALSDRKAWLATQKAQKAAEPQRPDGATVRTPGGEMVVAPPVKRWMDEHPRFYSDPTYYNHAVGAHSTIIADGIQEGTPAYFRELSARMGQFEKFEAFERGEHANGGDGVTTQQGAPRQPARRASAASAGAPVSRGTAPVSYSQGGHIDPLAVARRMGGTVTVDDLREFARINGYGRDDAGFQKYLKEQEEIYQIERAGGDTGMRVEGVYR